MASEEIPKTFIVTPLGMFEFLRLLFGLQNTGNTFQRMMDPILGNLPLFIYLIWYFGYYDDLYSASIPQSSAESYSGIELF